MTLAPARSRASFVVPPELYATRPPEASGRERDTVRLLVARANAFAHGRFGDVGDHLAPGDLLVVNVSATLAAAVDGMQPDGTAVVVHFSSPLSPDRWVVELRAADRSRRSATPGEVVYLPGGVRLVVEEARSGGDRLWSGWFQGEGTVEEYLGRFGRPIAYDYVRDRWPLEAYQAVFARVPGSAEMPSAARPFTHRLVTDLVARGIVVAPVLLHCGVSSPEAGEPPEPERFEVPAATARLVNETRRAGGRVVAVGTTSTRALETVARRDGLVTAGKGVTDLVLDAARPARVVDGLVTGWHAPDASHLSLLEAVAGPDLVAAAYEAALSNGYLWHEFGESCLLLPDRDDAGRARRPDPYSTVSVPSMSSLWGAQKNS